MGMNSMFHEQKEVLHVRAEEARGKRETVRDRHGPHLFLCKMRERNISLLGFSSNAKILETKWSCH